MRITNAHVYLTIAEEALDIMRKYSENNRTPKPNGEPGFIIKYDPNRTAFKNALIAIVFAANYLEAIFYLEGTKNFGESKYKDIDQKKYEEKLKCFGITDVELISAAVRLRTARKDITHEKAKEKLNGEVLRIAQDEAIAAVVFVKKIGQLLQEK